jgi:UDP-2-acetamido-2-deoxy-ribo-hexuluronate aminotransferase
MQFIDLKTQYRLVSSEVSERIARVLDHGQYIMGPEVAELEELLADFVGAKHCVGLASGTDALLVAMMALGIGPGDEVVTTPFTFIATGETIALIGAKPVFVDIEPSTYNIDPALIESAITERTRAILPVSLYGQCADMDAIDAIAARHGIPVIEDGAQSFGALYRGRKSCALSTIGCTSFFPAKPLGAYGDAGAAFTDDDSLAIAMREIRNHGQDRRYHHPRLGINGRIDTLQAAILIAKMKLFPGETERRSALGERYSQLLAERGASPTDGGGDGVLTPYIAPDNRSVFAQYTVQVPERDTVAAALADRGIPTAVHYPVPLNAQPVFADAQAVQKTPISARVAGRVLSLPMHPYLEESDKERIVEAVAQATGLS